MNRPDKAGRARSLRAVGVSATIVAAALLTAGCGGSADASAPRDDRGDLTQLIYRFYNDMEYGQFDKLNTVLTDDVVVTNAGGKTQGRDKVIAQSAEAAKTEGRTYHLVSNVLVDLDGDKAKVAAQVVELFGSKDTPKGKMAPEPNMTLDMQMRFETTRTAEGWRVSSIDGTLALATQAKAATGQ